MGRPGYVDRDALKRWADCRESQSNLPRLIRHLIHETTPNLYELDMPAGEGVAAGGWDGLVRSAEKTPWVAEGLSVWELSVSSNPKKKADDDYAKRTANPDGVRTSECTFVEVILRPWTTRNEWVESKRSENVWKDVKALGLDEIEDWLEQAPVTWAWLSEQCGLSPHGLHSGSNWWSQWSKQTKPALTPQVVLAGRNEARDQLLNRLDEPGLVTTLAGASMEEICAFVVAAAKDWESHGKGEMLARLAFVDKLTTWRQLIASPGPLVLVPTEPELQREIPQGSKHSFCVPVVHREGADVVLPALASSEVASALHSAGVEDMVKANELGRLARRSLTALRRKLAVNVALRRPSWAEANASRNLRAILMAGAWGDCMDGDRRILEDLSGVDYETFREVATRDAANPADPMVMRTAGSFNLVSVEDAWMLLSHTLTQEDFARFERVAKTVLTEADPDLEVSRNLTLRIQVHGKARCYSEDLRRGIAESLILLSIPDDSAGLRGRWAGEAFVDRLVGEVFEWTSKDCTGRGWQSLADVLPQLAESAPDIFLRAVDEATKDDDSLLFTTLRDVPDSWPNVKLLGALLSALERVSWSSQRFGYAVELLARLGEADLGGRMADRPADSLAKIFRPLHPDNAVSVESQIRVLNIMRGKHPATAWAVELSMLPKMHDTHFFIAAPQFHAWKPEKIAVTWAELRNATTAAVVCCVEDAGQDAQRWASIIEHTPQLPPSDREYVLDALRQMARCTDLTIEFKHKVWEALMSLIGSHREYFDASWALPQEELKKFEYLAGCYRPDSSFLRHLALFQSSIPSIGISLRDGYEVFEEKLGCLRVEALKEIESEGGFDAVRRLTLEAAVPGCVGVALKNIGDTYEDELLGWLGSTEGSLVSAGTAYFGGRYESEGLEYIKDLVECRDLTVIQRARLLLAVRDNLADIWDLAAAENELEIQYWSLFQPWGLGGGFDKVREAAERLIRVGRHTAALKLVYTYVDRETERGCPHTARLVVEALTALRLDRDNSAAEERLSDYEIHRIFDYLESMREHLDPRDLIRLQWSYLSALKYEGKVDALSDNLAADPSFFVDIVCLAHPATPTSGEVLSAEAQPEDEQIDRSATVKASELLFAWDSPPGLINGAMDAGSLRSWVVSAIELLEERGRIEVGLQHIGQVLWHTPPDADDTWPGLVVRELLEDLKLDHIERGLGLQILNSRGVTSRGLEEGGDQERELAREYWAKAEKIAFEAPRTAALLRKIASEYDSEALKNDEDAERFRRGLYY